MDDLLKCGRADCTPRFRIADGEEHVGSDLYVRCMTCSQRGPHVECERSTPDLRALVGEAWNADMAARSSVTEKGG